MLRRAIASDANEILVVRNAAIRGLALSHYSEKEIEDWCAARVAASYVGEIDKKVVLVNEQHGGLVAMGQLNPIAAFIEGIYVLPAFSRQGVGLSLLRTLERNAAELGIMDLGLDASLNAVDFYRRAGYSTAHIRPKNHAPVTGTIYMQRHIYE